MTTETEQSVDKLQISPPGKPRELQLWLIDQLTILAEAMGETVTPARLKIYRGDLADITQAELAVAFQRARCECRFFPKIAELRELAGRAAKDERAAEADAAWKFVNDYLRKWGTTPYFSGGKTIYPPALPEGIKYALRRIGGLRALRQVTEKTWPFMYRDFCEAYNLAPLADTLAPQFASKFSMANREIKLLSGTALERPEGDSDSSGQAN